MHETGRLLKQGRRGWWERAQGCAKRTAWTNSSQDLGQASKSPTYSVVGRSSLSQGSLNPPWRVVGDWGREWKCGKDLSKA